MSILWVVIGILIFSAVVKRVIRWRRFGLRYWAARYVPASVPIEPARDSKANMFGAVASTVLETFDPPGFLGVDEAPALAPPSPAPQTAPRGARVLEPLAPKPPIAPRPPTIPSSS